jgi:hypothetical protein
MLFLKLFKWINLEDFLPLNCEVPVCHEIFFTNFDPGLYQLEFILWKIACY